MGWKYNPASIEYKLSEGEDTKTKTIKEISEFSVNESYKYKRFTVNIDRSTNSLDKLLTGRSPEWNQEVIFLQLLVEGEISLYQYQESNFTRYFFTTDNITTEQLVYKKFMRNSNVVENNMYRQQLYNLMNGDGSDEKKYEKINYVEDDLVELFSAYNSTKNGKVVNMSGKHNKGYVNIRITPGITFTSLNVANVPRKLDIDFNNKTGFRAGIEFEYVMPFNNNKWSIFVDPHYHSYTDEKNQGEAVAKVDYKYVGIPIGLRHYMFLNQNAKIFVNAAYVLNISLGESNFEYYQYNIYNTNIQNISGSGGFTVGAGFGYKRYSAEVRYYQSNDFLEAGAWETKYTSVGLILGYKIL